MAVDDARPIADVLGKQSQDESVTVDMGFAEIEADLWGDDWVDAYLETADWHSVDNESLHRGCLLALLGQAIPEGTFTLGAAKDHVRINPFMVQTSGTGKGPAVEFAKSIAREASISFWDADSITNAGFVGKIDENGDEIPGIAAEKDIIAWREGMHIFKAANASYDDGLLENINKVVDGDTIGRAMSGGRLEYTPNCSVMATTYPPAGDDLDVDKLLRNGNLSRYIFYYREVSKEERKQMNRLRMKRANSTTDYAKLSIDHVERLAATLTAITDELGMAPEFNLQQVDLERMADLVDEIRAESLDGVPGDVADRTGPADSRYLNHTLRVACLLTALDGRSTHVTDRHIDRALEFIEPAWRSLAAFVDRHARGAEADEPPGSLKMLAVLRDSGEWMTKGEVADALGLKSERQIQNHAAELRRVPGFIDEAEGGGAGNKTAYRYAEYPGT